MGHERKTRPSATNPYKSGCSANPYAGDSSYRSGQGSRNQRPRSNPYRFPQKQRESSQRQQRRSRGRPIRQTQRGSDLATRPPQSQPTATSSHLSRTSSESTTPPGPPEDTPPFEARRSPSQPRSSDQPGPQRANGAPVPDHEEILRVVKQVQEYSAQLVEQLRYKDFEIASLKKMVKVNGGDCSEMQAQICKLQTALDSKTNESLKLQQDNAELVSSNKNLLEANQLLSDDLTERDREIGGAKHTVEEMEQSLEFEKSASEGLSCTIVRLKEQVSMLQTEAREIIADKMARLEQSFTADERERDLRRTYDKVEYLNNVVREHYERNQDLEVENMKARETMVQIEREKAKAKKENEALKKENISLRSSKSQVAKLMQGNVKGRSTTPPPPPFPIQQKREKALWKDGDSELSNFLENDLMSVS